MIMRRTSSCWNRKGPSSWNRPSLKESSGKVSSKKSKKKTVILEMISKCSRCRMKRW